MVSRTTPFVLSGKAGVVCPRNGRGVRGGTRFLTDCVGSLAKGSLTMRTNASNGKVVLRLNKGTRGPRKCRLGMADSRIIVSKPARTKMFCNVRALHGSVPITRKISVTLPTIRVGSCPHFSCHNTVLSISHRFFPMSSMGHFVSVLTLRGVGHFR